MKIHHLVLFTLLLAQMRLQSGPLDTWTLGNLYVTPQVLTYGDGHFIVMGVPGGAAMSQDGTSWSSVNTPALGGGPTALAYGNGEFVVTGGSDTNPIAATSLDGVNWILGNNVGVNAEAMAYGNGQFLMIGFTSPNRAQAAITSHDGINWSSVNAPSLIPGGLTYGHGEFILAGADADGNAGVETSSDGVNWTLVSSLSFYPDAIGYGDGQFLIIGSSPANNSYESIISQDGIHWSSVNAPSPLIYPVIAYGYGKFVVAAYDNFANSVVATSAQCFFPMSQGGSSQRPYFPKPRNDNWGSLIYAQSRYEAFYNSLTLQPQLMSALMNRELYNCLTNKGCKVTCLCMALNQLGYNTLPTPDGNPITPRYMNAWLDANGAYTKINSFNPTPDTSITAWINDNVHKVPHFAGQELVDSAIPLLKKSFPGLQIRHPASENDIINAINQNNPVMLRVEGNNHSVYAFDCDKHPDGKTYYEVIDPASVFGGPKIIGDAIKTIPSTTTKTLSQMSAAILPTWIFSKQGVLTMSVEPGCPLGLTVTDPLGRVTSFSAQAGITTNQIPGASFYVECPDLGPDEDPWTSTNLANWIASYPPMNLVIPESAIEISGIYEVEALGLTNGAYTISMNGPYLQTPLNVSGIISQNQTVMFTTSNIPSIQLGISATSSNIMITLAGPSGNYNVYASSNLTSWTNIGSVMVDTNNNGIFNDTAVSAMSKFYRVVSQ